MKKQSLSVKITFTTDVLGSWPENKTIAADYIASKAPTTERSNEELESIPESEESSKRTIFPRDTKGVHLWDFHLRGFIKEACRFQIEMGDLEIAKTSISKAVDTLVFVNPRKVYFANPDGTVVQPSQLTSMQRSLRAMTMQGERIALADSDLIQAGCWLGFTVEWFEGENGKSKIAKFNRDVITQCLDYGALKGMGQWRSGGFGRFTWEETAK